MFRVTNADGLQVASYPSRSELDTWLKISTSPDTHRIGAETDENNFEIHDEDGNLAYRVSGPKPAAKPKSQDQPQP